MKNYICLTATDLQEIDGYCLVPIRESDMEAIRLWRNDQIAILRQKDLLSQTDQRKYFTQFIEPSFSEKEPTQILFSYLQNGQLIGYGGLVHIDWILKCAEVSFLLNTKIQESSPSFEALFLRFFQMLERVAFQTLHFHKLTAVVFDNRKTMPILLQKVGFVKEGQLKDHVLKDGIWHDATLFGLIHHTKGAYSK